MGHVIYTQMAILMFVLCYLHPSLQAGHVNDEKQMINNRAQIANDQRMCRPLSLLKKTLSSLIVSPQAQYRVTT